MAIKDKIRISDKKKNSDRKNLERGDGCYMCVHWLVALISYLTFESTFANQE